MKGLPFTLPQARQSTLTPACSALAPSCLLGWGRVAPALLTALAMKEGAVHPENGLIVREGVSQRGAKLLPPQASVPR